MFTSTTLITTLAIVIGTTGVVMAEEATLREPNYRCEAAMMLEESRELKCQARCERKSDEISDESGETPRSNCMKSCHERCDRRKTTLAGAAVCIGVSVFPDPERCAAKLLAALSQLNFCLSNCPDDDPHSIACGERCNQRYGDVVQRVASTELCKEGKFPVCSYE